MDSAVCEECIDHHHDRHVCRDLWDGCERDQGSDHGVFDVNRSVSMKGGLDLEIDEICLCGDSAF